MSHVAWNSALIFRPRDQVGSRNAGPVSTDIERDIVKRVTDLDDEPARRGKRGNEEHDRATGGVNESIGTFREIVGCHDEAVSCRLEVVEFLVRIEARPVDIQNLAKRRDAMGQHETPEA